MTSKGKSWRHSDETKAKMSAAQKRRFTEGKELSFYETDEGKRRAKAARDATRETMRMAAPICWIPECDTTVTLGAYGWSGPTSEYCVKHVAMDKRARQFHASLKDVYKTWEEQERKCRTCRRPLELSGSDRANVVHMDHCHIKNEFRGVLCRRCNSVLGYVSDDHELLRRLADYLERR